MGPGFFNALIQVSHVSHSHLSLLPFSPGKQETVALNQLVNQQETVDGCDAVADEIGYQLSLAVRLLGSHQLMPNGSDMLVAILYLVLQFVLAGLKIFQCVVDLLGHRHVSLIGWW